LLHLYLGNVWCWLRRLSYFHYKLLNVSLQIRCRRFSGKCYFQWQRNTSSCFSLWIAVKQKANLRTNNSNNFQIIDWSILRFMGTQNESQRIWSVCAAKPISSFLGRGAFTLTTLSYTDVGTSCILRVLWPYYDFSQYLVCYRNSRVLFDALVGFSALFLFLAFVALIPFLCSVCGVALLQMLSKVFPLSYSWVFVSFSVAYVANLINSFCLPLADKRLNSDLFVCSQSPITKLVYLIHSNSKLGEMQKRGNHFQCVIIHSALLDKLTVFFNGFVKLVDMNSSVFGVIQ